MAEQVLSEQLYAAAYAAGMGVLFALLYDGFRLLYRQFPHRWLEMLLDSIFSVTFVTVFFLLVTSVAQTKLRGFLLLACGSGWLVWRSSGGFLLRQYLGRGRRKAAGRRNHEKNIK